MQDKFMVYWFMVFWL